MSTHRLGRALRASIAVAAVSGALAPAAYAQAPPPAGADGHFVIGFEPRTTDAAARGVTGVMHCVPPEQAGRLATIHVADGVDLAQFAPGAALGIELVRGPEGQAEIVRIVPPPCQFRTGDAPSGPGQAPPPGVLPPGSGQPGGPGAGAQTGPHDGVPALERGFLNRVWKFEGEADGYRDGVLSMTLSKILNLPKRMAEQDDDLVDQDTVVLVGSSTRVYDGTKLVRERREASELASAENVRVQGKMLPPSKWRKDEDDQPVPTIRAKKVFILG
jgi:hypothetical protein